MRRPMLAALAMLALGGCKVSVKDSGALPEVDTRKRDGATEIEVRPGRMPEVDVRADSAALPKLKAPDIPLPSVGVRDTTSRDTTPRR